jgi:hypothetical protein
VLFVETDYDLKNYASSRFRVLLPDWEQNSYKLCLMTIASRSHPFPSRTGP